MLVRDKNKNTEDSYNGDIHPNFVVDLKKESAKETKKIKKIESAWLEKIVEYDFSKIREIFYNFILRFKKYFTFKRRNKNLDSIQSKGKNQIEKVAQRIDRINSTLSSQEKKTRKYLAKFNHLAFFSLSKLFLITVGKISYYLGFSVVSGFRFFYFGLVDLFLLFRLKKKNKKKYYFKKFLKSFRYYIFYFYYRRQKKKFKKEIKARIKAQIEEIVPSKKAKLKNRPRSSKKKAPRPLVFQILKFAVILLVIIAPFKIYSYYNSLDLNSLKGRVLGVTEKALSSLGGASDSIMAMDFSEASNKFSEASTGFLEAQQELENINNILFTLASVVPNDQVKMAAYSKEILAAGEHSANIGNYLSLALSSFFDEDKKENKKLTALITDFNEQANLAADEAKALEYNLAKINPDILPDKYREQFSILKNKTNNLSAGILSFVHINENLKEFLGETEDKRYLLVFQNNTEMRASGGFIGSYALIDFDRGEIENIEAPGGGSYDTAGGLRTLVVAPEPLSLVDPLWHFWDANWWPDWPTSARKLMWFYEKSDGPTVNGVISLTPTVMENFLKVFGPLDMSEKYGVILDENNFWEEVQKITEEKPAWHEDGEALNAEGERLNPKEIIGDMLGKIISGLPDKINQENFTDYIEIMEKSLSEKHIMFYFTDPDLQAAVSQRGWDGAIKDTKWDYLAVINSNIAGAKSDKKIKEKINHSVEIMTDGSVVDTLEITRTHTGERGEEFTGVRNVDWLRVYVPEGSVLLEAKGFKKPDESYFEQAEESWQVDPEIYRTENLAGIHTESGTKIYIENNKTVFANWTMVDPGESVTLYLKYRTPLVLEEETKIEEGFLDKVKNKIKPESKQLLPYALLVQKQPGSIGSEIKSSLKISPNFEIAWKYPEDLAVGLDGWRIDDVLNVDKYWSIVLERKE